MNEVQEVERIRAVLERDDVPMTRKVKELNLVLTHENQKTSVKLKGQPWFMGWAEHNHEHIIEASQRVKVWASLPYEVRRLLV